MRFFDELRLSSFLPIVPFPNDLEKSMRELSRRWLAKLESAGPTVVAIENVAKYYFEETEETWDFKDFPCLTPPWPLAFLEYPAPRNILTRDGCEPFDRELLGHRFGVLLDSYELGSAAGFQGLPDCELLPGHRTLPPPAEGLRWVIQASVFGERRGDIRLYGTLCFVLDPAGEYVDLGIGGLHFLPPFKPELSDQEIKDCGVNLWCMLLPALLAISFMHCRNTQLVNHDPPAALAKATLQRHGIRPITYKTLEIAPVQKILAEKGKSAQNGLRLALHICRGHFKDYRNSKGLFGKHKDLYWWDQHVRGHVDEGLVFKDYSVAKPKGKESA